MPDIHTFTINIDTPDGTVGPATISICNEPTRLSDLAPPIHALADGVVGLAVKRAGREGRILSCRAGCGICCCQLVPLAPAEVFYLAERILAQPIAERIPVLKRFQSIEDTLNRTGLIHAISSLGETNDNNTIAREYFRLGLSCPFLVENSCSIHEWRPIACREYNVTSPPGLCADPFTNAISAIRVHRRASAGLSRLCTQVAGLPPGLVPMPLLFDYYETYRDVSERTWPGVELFDQAMDFVCGKKPTLSPPPSQTSAGTLKSTLLP
jgi:Fe-S-cluster containining protein